MEACVRSASSARPAAPQWWSIADVPTAQRTEAWQDMLSRNFRDWQVPGPVDTAFRARLRHRDVAGLRVVECVCDPCHGRRLKQHVSCDDAAYIGVQVTRSGREVFRRGDEIITVGPGDVVLWTSDRPTEFTVTERLHKISLILPWSELRDRFPRGTELGGTVLDGRSGIGAVLRSQIESLALQLDALETDDLAAVRRATFELLTAALSARIDRSPRPLSRQHLQRVKDYVLDHLQDEDLSPTTIARAHHISPRYLHLLFAQTSQSVSAYIREERLLRCRESLANAAYRERSVAEIAYQWGFNDPAHFSRVYKQRFGETPGRQRG
jgi:AraC-like DNA-binding protein